MENAKSRNPCTSVGKHQLRAQGHLSAGSPTGNRRWAAEGRQDEGCRTLVYCHSLGWQEVDSFGPGSVGRTDGQEFSAASKSAKRQDCLPSLSATARSHLVTASCRGPRLKTMLACPGVAWECVIPRLCEGLS